MSCNCNRANPNCEPCMICTPSGVTDLPQCTPVDPCEGQQINGTCVTYNGIDFDCLGVTTGDDILQVMFAILEYYQPASSEDCCDIGEGIIEYAPPLTTTTTTIAPTTTTTTTTVAPPECSYYEVTNTDEFGSSAIEYVPCNSEEYVAIEISTSIFICVNNAYPINIVDGTVTSQNWGPCDTSGPTTTTTTIAVVCECEVYTIENLLTTSTTLTYTACEDGDRILISLTIPPSSTISVCACSDILDNTSRYLNINNLGLSCDSTPTTTTTTTETPLPCNCYEIFTEEGNLVTYVDCNGNETLVAFEGTPSPNPPYVGIPSMRFCANVAPSVTPEPYFIRNFGDCGLSTACNPVSTTTTSTTTTTTTIAPVCNCYTLENPTAGYLGYEWGDCDKIALEYSTVAPGTTAYRCSLDTYLNAHPDLIVTNLGLCDSVNCNPPLESIVIGDSSSEVCEGGGTSITVTGNLPSFCDSTEFYSDDFITLPSGSYYLYNGQYYIIIEVTNGSSTAISSTVCIACTTTSTTTTSTTSTTTTTTLLTGRRATIPVPVLPNADLVISYTDTTGTPVVGQVIPAQASPLDYYLCIQCDTTITVDSGTVPGTIGYSDTSSIECNCI